MLQALGALKKFAIGANFSTGPPASCSVLFNLSTSPSLLLSGGRHRIPFHLRTLHSACSASQIHPYSMGCLQLRPMDGNHLNTYIISRRTYRPTTEYGQNEPCMVMAPGLQQQALSSKSRTRGCDSGRDAESGIFDPISMLMVNINDKSLCVGVRVCPH